MMKYVTDTHSLVWYFLEDSRLSESALKAIDDTISMGEIIVPTVVLAEIMFISKKGRIPLTFNKTLEKIEWYANFRIASLDRNVLVAADRLEAELEMHDKLIVATAIVHQASLITRDAEIRNSKVVRTVW